MYSQFRAVDESDYYMYPNLLNLNEHLHILYNAVKEGIEAMENHKDYLDKLRCVEGFLSDRALRRAYQARCEFESVKERDTFTHYSTVHIDWRWEFLSKALNRLVPLIRCMQ